MCANRAFGRTQKSQTISRGKKQGHYNIIIADDKISCSQGFFPAPVFYHVATVKYLY